jgi:hypothetical protein
MDEQAKINALDGIITALDKHFNEGRKGEDRDVGFVLMTFPINGGKTESTYTSNGVKRSYVARIMKNLIKRLEAAKETIQ